MSAAALSSNKETPGGASAGPGLQRPVAVVAPCPRTPQLPRPATIPSQGPRQRRTLLPNPPPYPHRQPLLPLPHREQPPLQPQPFTPQQHHYPTRLNHRVWIHHISFKGEPKFRIRFRKLRSLHRQQRSWPWQAGSTSGTFMKLPLEEALTSLPSLLTFPLPSTSKTKGQAPSKLLRPKPSSFTFPSITFFHKNEPFHWAGFFSGTWRKGGTCVETLHQGPPSANSPGTSRGHADGLDCHKCPSSSDNLCRYSLTFLYNFVTFIHLMFCRKQLQLPLHQFHHVNAMYFLIHPSNFNFSYFCQMSNALNALFPHLFLFRITFASFHICFHIFLGQLLLITISTIQLFTIALIHYLNFFL